MPNRAPDGPTPDRPDPDDMTGLNGRFALLLDAITQAARRVWCDGWWYWDLKPDLRPGETFTI